MIFLFLGFLVIGLMMALRPQQAVHRIEVRIAEGSDRYHEEQRSYAAYPWLRSVATTGRRGWMMAIGSLIGITISVWR